jgi:hypothetical protein
MEGGSRLRDWVTVAAVAALAVCLLMIGLPRVFGVSSQDAETSISDADQALQAAFMSVSNTERAGVNVSGLLNRLDEAGLALTVAQAAFDGGNFSEAMNEAATSETLANGVAADAVAMKNAAGSWFSNFLFSLEVGFLGSGVLTIVLALTWLWLKRTYAGKLSKFRPEVSASCGV